MTMEIRPVTLDGKRVRMEPLSWEPHFDGLMAIGLDPELWRWTLNVIENRADLRAYLEEALRMQAEGSALPFATMDKASGRVVGCTRFGNIEPKHLRVEIGWTWVGKEFQRSYVNTEAKYLMLRHGFETWGCRRVELKTNVLNKKSRDAMLRIGAKEEGILRKHAVSDRGVSRDTIYYSIIDDEWPGVKATLEGMMAREWASSPGDAPARSGGRP
jgi:RimJ/RimL family protein N-acetyltransferase